MAEDQELHSLALQSSSLSDEDYDRFLESEAMNLSGQQKRRRQLLLLLLLASAIAISVAV
ncbi:MAG TPA: hypothetical protein PKA37_03430 [Planctomycetota bacterium]|nr:hypothetical protein [Planctomycetota bacterium]